MPKVKALERQANRYRQEARPKKPSVDFQLDPACVPQIFLCIDVFVNGATRLMFCTDTQLNLATSRFAHRVAHNVCSSLLIMGHESITKY